jgi:hypothetical protein
MTMLVRFSARGRSYVLSKGASCPLRPLLPLRYSVIALSVVSHLPAVSPFAPENEERCGEGRGEESRPEARELPSAVNYSAVFCFCIRERVLSG